MLTLKDREGDRLDLKVSAVDSQWTVPGKYTAGGRERLAVLGRYRTHALRGGRASQ